MALEWLLAAGEDFDKVVGPAASPSNPISRTQPPGAVGGASWFRAIGSLDGQEIWLGGDAWGADAALSCSLWRSQDGGDTWNNAYSLHPGSNLGETFDFWGFPDSGDLWLCGLGASNINCIAHWTGSVWSTASPKGYIFSGTSKRTNSLWGRSPTDMYCISKTAAGEEIMHNDGSGWSAEPSLKLETQLANDGGGGPLAITGDATHLYVWAHMNSGGFQVYRGTFGGTWTQETRSWDATGVHLEEQGKIIMADELGQIWVAMGGGGTAQYEIHRRSVGGTWALVHSYSTTGTVVGGLYVVDSQNILVSCGTRMLWLEGSTWYDVAKYSGTTPAYGAWGYLPDPDPPVITPLNPTDQATGVSKDEPIQFVIEDPGMGVSLDQVLIYVRGNLVYDGGVIAGGWGVTFSGDVNTWIGEITPPALERWGALEDIAVRVVATDANNNTGERRWSFTAIRNLSVQIYPMILSSLRRQDEGQ